MKRMIAVIMFAVGASSLGLNAQTPQTQGGAASPLDYQTLQAQVDRVSHAISAAEQVAQHKEMSGQLTDQLQNGLNLLSRFADTYLKLPGQVQSGLVKEMADAGTNLFELAGDSRLSQAQQNTAYSLARSLHDAGWCLYNASLPDNGKCEAIARAIKNSGF